MKTIYTTDVFDAWFESLRDKQAARRIQARIDRAEDGPVGFRLELIVLKTEILGITSRWVTVCLK